MACREAVSGEKVRVVKRIQQRTILFERMEGDSGYHVASIYRTKLSGT